MGHRCPLNALHRAALGIDDASDWNVEEIELRSRVFVVFLIQVEIGPYKVAFDGVDRRAVEDV